MKAKIFVIVSLFLLMQMNYSSVLAEGPQAEVEPNNSIETAQDLEVATWSLDADPDIVSSTTIPHVTIAGSGDNSFDYYAFMVSKAGSKGIFDIDLTSGGFDSYLTLYDNNGTFLKSNDDSGVNQGAGGSNTSLDSYLEYTFPTSGLYIIRVAARIGGPIKAIPAGVGYQLQVSIEDHSTGWQIYLPGVMRNWSPSSPPPPPPPPTFDSVEITCLYALNWWRRDSPPYDIIRSSYPPPCLMATKVDVKHIINSIGRQTGYEAIVERPGKPNFEMDVTYLFNSGGGVTGANVAKTYESGEQYQMIITKFCPTIGQLVGYKMDYEGQEISVGNCF